MKTCSRCNEEKPLAAFSINRTKPDGRGHACKSCHAAYKRELRRREPKPRNTAVQAIVSPTTVDLAWAAGFLEGDGFFLRDGTVGASQVEWAPISKLVRIFGGLVRPVAARRPTQSHYLEWEANGARGRGIMYTLYPFLSPKRRAQIRASLDA
jgi:hypothetical protein